MDKLLEIRLASTQELDPKKTFECGQCFRWEDDGSGVYRGVVRGHAAQVETQGDDVILRGGGDAALWHDYFDLSNNYSAANTQFCARGGYLADCTSAGAGIRILRQERWETLCSFIISQCNNIPRIKKIILTLCRLYGEPISDGLFAFPSAERIASLSEAKLEPLRSGYRAAYILSAAREVSSGSVDLDALSACGRDEAVAKLLEMSGVGKKVANCVALYGLNHMSGFPIDTWMKRALRENFPPNFDPDTLGEFAGLAQQYIFYYARSGGARNERI